MGRNKTRPKAPTRALTGALIVGTVATIGALTAVASFLSPVPLVDNRAPADGGTLRFSWQPPVRQTTSSQVALKTRTPADEALSAAVGDGTFDGYASTKAAETTIYGGPYAGACKTLLNPAPTAGAMRRTQDGSASLAVTAWAYTAGAGAAAVEHAAAAVAECDAPADSKPILTAASTPGGNGFVATSRNGGDGVAWMLWSRGDVVLAVVGTVPRGGGPLTRVRTLADRVDAAAVAALSTTCANVDSVARDKSRNPYLGSYSPYTYTRRVSVPPVSSKGPKVTLGRTPDLGDVRVPAPTEFQDLAPVVLPPGFEPGDELVEMSAAQRGPAPALVSPEDIPVPEGVVATEPVAPGAVAQAKDLASFDVLSADKTGPGCGWQFARTTAPNVSAEALKARTIKNVEDAFWELAVSQADTKLQVADVAEQTAQYKRSLAGWNLYLRYQGQVDAARSALQVAQSAYESSVKTYQDYYDQWLESTEPVEPEPVETEPTEPEAEPLEPQPLEPLPTPTLPTPTLPTEPEVLP